MTTKNWLTTIAAAFGGGFVTALMAAPPSALLTWGSAKPFVAGALVAGAGAVYHLFQPKPAAS